MYELLKFVCLAMAAYGAYGLYAGEVYSKNGMSGRMIYREEEPKTFWFICLTYVVMGIFLFGILRYKYG